MERTTSHDYNMEITRQVCMRQTDPRKALVAAKSAARGIVKVRFEAFACTGMGSKIKPLALEAMARRYA